MSTDIKLDKDQLTNVIQSGGFIGNSVGKSGEKAQIKLLACQAEDVLPKLAVKEILSVLEKSERKISGRRVVKAGKEFTLFISNENLDGYYQNSKVIRKFKSIN